MRPTEEIARDIVEHPNPANLRSLVTGLELVELAKEMLFWRDRFNRAQEQYDELRRENQRLRDALRRRDELLIKHVGLQLGHSEALVLALEAHAEADALRALAWRWCMVARDGWELSKVLAAGEGPIVVQERVEAEGDDHGEG